MERVEHNEAQADMEAEPSLVSAAVPPTRCRVCRRKFEDKRRDRRPDKEDPSRCRGCAQVANALGKAKR